MTDKNTAALAIADEIVRNVSELTEFPSPDDDDALLVSVDDLREIAAAIIATHLTDQQEIAALKAEVAALRRINANNAAADPQPSGGDGDLVPELIENHYDDRDGTRVRKSFERLCSERRKAIARITELSATTARQARELLTAEHQAQDALDRVAQLEAAEWEVRHTSTANDMVQMGMARDAALEQVAQLEARYERLAEHLQGVLHEADWMAAQVKINPAALAGVKKRLSNARAALEQENSHG